MKVTNSNGSLIAREQHNLDEYANKVQDIESFIDFPKMDHNPFTCLLGDILNLGWNTKGVMNNIGNVEITNKTTGEIYAASENKVFRSKELVDTGKFMKIYTNQLKEMFSLSYSALKVYGYFIKEMQNTKDSTEIYFDIKECMEFCNYNGHAMIYRGLSELIKKLFICRTVRHPIYYVNPLYAFNGNRLLIFKEYERNDYFESNELTETNE